MAEEDHIDSDSPSPPGRVASLPIPAAASSDHWESDAEEASTPLFLGSWPSQHAAVAGPRSDNKLLAALSSAGDQFEHGVLPRSRGVDRESVPPHRPGAEPGTAADRGPSPGRLRRHSFEQPDGAGPNVSEYDASTTPLLAHAVLPPGASTADDSERPNTPPRSRMPTYVRSARSVKALPLVE